MKMGYYIEKWTIQSTYITVAYLQSRASLRNICSVQGDICCLLIIHSVLLWENFYGCIHIPYM